MNDIVTILIIIGVIISFLSKIFRQQKKTETEQKPAPVAKPKPVEWLPSWFEETEPEQEFPEFKEENLVFETVTKTKEKPPVIEQKKHEPRVKVPIRETVTEPQKAKTLSVFNISLESPDDLKQGIVLAEILGPCKANKKRITY